MVNGIEPPTAREPLLHITNWAVAWQPGLAANATPAGRVSETDRPPVLSDGPRFETNSVKANPTGDPAVADPGAAFTTDRSAVAPTVVVAVDVLFAGFGSDV